MLWRVAAAAAAALAVVVWTDRGASEAGTGAAVIRITGDDRRYHRIDVGRRGRSPADTEIYVQNLHNRRITRRPIGHSEFVCTLTLDITRSCRATFFLPRGKLVAGGSLRFGGIYQIPILGGTGLYDNARGTLTATRLSSRRYLLYFRLVG
jgi:hypothetical protein